MKSYYSACVNWPRDAVLSLHRMIERNLEVSRRTFLKHVDRGELARLEASLGYTDHPKRGLTMAADWHVTYHRSKVFGKTCYYLRWSAIEYVFV